VPNYYLESLIPLIKSKGLIPVFCDIDKKTLSGSLDDILPKINERTAFVVLCHTFGICQNMEGFIKMIKEKSGSILIIEDCAHAFGSEYRGQKLGTFGDFSFFSFNYIKTLTTLEGGTLIVNNNTFIDKINKAYNSYQFPRIRETFKKIAFYYFFLLLFNTPLLYALKYALRKRGLRKTIKGKYHSLSENEKKQRLSPFLAFLGYRQLQLFEKKQKKISSLLEEYKKHLKKSVWKRTFIGENSKYSNYYFAILAERSSEEMEKELAKNKIDVGIKDEIMGLCENNNKLKNSKEVFEKTLQLPLYYSLSPATIEKIAKTLNRII